MRTIYAFLLFLICLNAIEAQERSQAEWRGLIRGVLTDSFGTRTNAMSFSTDKDRLMVQTVQKLSEPFDFYVNAGVDFEDYAIMILDNLTDFAILLENSEMLDKIGLQCGYKAVHFDYIMRCTDNVEKHYYFIVNVPNLMGEALGGLTVAEVQDILYRTNK
jgi:hypothetical protein